MGDSVAHLEALADLRGAVGRLRGDTMAATVQGFIMIRVKNMTDMVRLQQEIPDDIAAYAKSVNDDEDRRLLDKVQSTAQTYLATCRHMAELSTTVSGMRWAAAGPLAIIIAVLGGVALAYLVVARINKSLARCADDRS